MSDGWSGCLERGADSAPNVVPYLAEGIHHFRLGACRARRVREADVEPCAAAEPDRDDSVLSQGLEGARSRQQTGQS